MDIKTTRLAYQFGNDGQTESIQLAFNAILGANYVNATIEIKQDELDNGQSFDDLTKKQIEAIGRKKLADMTAVDEETPEQTK